MSQPADGVELFVPGRLCLFGEHSDWAAQFGMHNGYCLVTGTEQGLCAVARRSETFKVAARVPDPLGRPCGPVQRMSWDCDAGAVLAAGRDTEEFFRYCAGTAHEMLGQPGVRGGIDLEIRAMDLPLRKGVASSAAVCILVAKAFDAVYRLGLFPHELMDVAYRGERLTGSQCGRMDQACIYGKLPVLLTFAKSGPIRVEPSFPGGGIHMFFVDLAGRKDTVKILSDLRKAYPGSPRLQQALGEANERIVRKAYRAVISGDSAGLGAAMTQAQRVFDEMVAPESPEELASPRLHELLDFADIADNVYGGKGVGSQGDGTAQFVARSQADRSDAMAKITAAFEQMQCFELTINPQAGEL